ncbi:Intracellular ribonuclease LX [Linum perenne]
MVNFKKIQLLFIIITQLLLQLVCCFKYLDYFMMASQWPAGVCSKGQPCIPVIPNDFTIHGYWPSNWNPNTPFVQVRYPMNMNDLAIALTTFPSLIDDMASEWPQLFLDPSRSNMGFWLMEYNAHGIYFTGTPHLYFNRALGVY